MVSCEGLGNGGVQAVMMAIVRNLKQNYHFDMLLFTNERRYYDDEFESYGGTIYRISRYEGNIKIRKKFDYYIRGYHVYKRIENLLQNEKFDIIHCNNEYESALVLKAAYKSGIKKRIVHSHIIMRYSNLAAVIINRRRKEIIEKYATIKIACSEEASKSFYMKAEDVHIIYNSYDNNKFDYNKYQHVKTNNLNIVQVGRYCKDKNQIFSIKILDSIRKYKPNTHLFLVGFDENNYIHEINQFIDKLNISDYVHLIPGDADIPKIFSTASALLLPSASEGFGIVLIEAQAMGLRCYASNSVPQSTNCGGVKYLSIDLGVNAWCRLILDDYLKDKGKHIQYNVSKFTLKNIIQEYKEIYSE